MPVLDSRALNRALLARQLLLDRSKMRVSAALEYLVGLQAQTPDFPYVGLWTRLEKFRSEDLARLVRARRAVRVVLMRSTIHLVTVGDGITLRPLMQPAVERGLWTGNYGRRLAGIDRDALAAAGRALLEQQPRTFSELGARLRERWPERDANALAMAVRGLVPLVQVPPRGLWGTSGPSAHTTFEAWTGRKLGAPRDAARMWLRYLAAFGPASVADMQAWSGLTGVRETIEPLRRRLRTFSDSRGRELFDLPDAPRPDRDTDAPPRFLPEFDNVLLAHADRTRIVDERHRARLFGAPAAMGGSVLVDGFVRARWRVVHARKTATLDVELLERVSASHRAALEGEGRRLLRFVAPDSDTQDVHVRLSASRL